MLKNKETYITVVDNTQVIRTTYKNGQSTIYGGFPPNATPHKKLRLKKEKED